MSRQKLQSDRAWAADSPGREGTERSRVGQRRHTPRPPDGGRGEFSLDVSDPEAWDTLRRQLDLLEPEK